MDSSVWLRRQSLIFLRVSHHISNVVYLCTDFYNHWQGEALVTALLLPGYCQVTDWLLPCYFLVTTWLHACYYLVTAWLLPVCCLVTAWLLPGYFLVTAWLLPGYYLVTYWLLPGRPFLRKTKSVFSARVPSHFNWPLPLHPVSFSTLIQAAVLSAAQ